MKKLKRAFSRLVPQGLKNIYHLALAIAANLFFAFPGRRIQVIGVTGTNGKTTTSRLILRILEGSGKRVAAATTIDFQIGEKRWENSSKFTTLSAWKLQRFLSEATRAGCEYAVLETSSHALDQHRVWGVRYRVAVITNVTREHLDYHGTMEHYRAAKRRLFERAEAGIINADMEGPEFFRTPNLKQALLYSTKKEADLMARNISLDFAATEWTTDGTRFRLPLPGLFNIENALAALGTARLLSIDFSLAQEALARVEGVPGRMELVGNDIGADIVVDFALTPDAFEKLYASVLPLKIPGTRIVHVFGACGERDRGKRPLLGEIASQNADIVILTNDEPYHEDPEGILDEIEAGISKKREGSYYRIPDRRLAIRRALELAERGDIVLVTGMGAEDSIAIGDRRVPWNERQVIEEELRRLGRK